MRTQYGLTLAFLGSLMAAICPSVGAATPAGFDHVYVIVLENQSFDDALYGPSPFIRRLAQTQGLATYYFGVTHPSLPNYLAMIAGDDFGIRDDAPSCYASELKKDEKCHALRHETLADQLEAKGLTWALYAQGLPQAGSLVIESPGGDAGALYAQKHNPFAYFGQIAMAPARRRNMKPLEDLQADLAAGAPSYSLIVPDQCEDGHGLASCPDRTDLTIRSDAMLERLVEIIRASKSWSERSAIIITFDEGMPPRGVSGAPAHVDCCGNRRGGHHVATIVVSKCGAPRRSARALDHYALLATVEDGFGLARLGKAAGAETLMDLVGGACP